MTHRTIYLAARYSRHPEMRHARDIIEGAGFGTVVSRWIEGNHQLADDEAEPATEAARFALEDMHDLEGASTLIAFTEPPRTGATRGGRHVELGMALALRKEVIVVGPRENVFCYLPMVEWFPDWPTVVARLLVRREP